MLGLLSGISWTFMPDITLKMVLGLNPQGDSVGKHGNREEERVTVHWQSPRLWFAELLSVLSW